MGSSAWSPAIDRWTVGWCLTENVYGRSSIRLIVRFAQRKNFKCRSTNDKNHKLSSDGRTVIERYNLVQERQHMSANNKIGRYYSREVLKNAQSCPNNPTFASKNRQPLLTYWHVTRVKYVTWRNHYVTLTE